MQYRTNKSKKQKMFVKRIIYGRKKVNVFVYILPAFMHCIPLVSSVRIEKKVLRFCDASNLRVSHPNWMQYFKWENSTLKICGFFVNCNCFLTDADSDPKGRKQKRRKTNFNNHTKFMAWEQICGMNVSCDFHTMSPNERKFENSITFWCLYCICSPK